MQGSSLQSADLPRPEPPSSHIGGGELQEEDLAPVVGGGGGVGLPLARGLLENRAEQKKVTV